MINLIKYYQQNKLRKYYQQLRQEALEAEKTGDIRRYYALNAKADKLVDQVIYS